MLDVARRRSEAVEWVEAGFLTYEHTGDPPGFVHSRHALHHLPDFWNGVALARIHACFASAARTLEHAGFEIRERDVRGGIYAAYVCVRP